MDAKIIFNQVINDFKTEKYSVIANFTKRFVKNIKTKDGVQNVNKYVGGITLILKIKGVEEEQSEIVLYNKEFVMNLKNYMSSKYKEFIVDACIYDIVVVLINFTIKNKIAEIEKENAKIL